MHSRFIYILTGCVAIMNGFASCRFSRNPDSYTYANRANEVMDSIYSHFGIPESHLLRENFPSDETFNADYLTEDNGQHGNPYSYLWPYSGAISAYRALHQSTGENSFIQILDSKVIPGLECYFDTCRSPAAYASYINDAQQSDRFYDDNIWLGIDFTELYLSSRRLDYLDKAKNLWMFIESGTDSINGGGIYWCEQKKLSKNTCSNAPGAVFALRLNEATNDSSYLSAAIKLYNWTKTNLQDSIDYLYFDNIDLNGHIGRAKFAYNSGQMLEAAVLLYNTTGDQSYMKDAQNIAESAFKYFFNGGEKSDSIVTYPLLNKGNIWFSAVMMRGYKELYMADGNSKYMDAFVRNLDNAWTVMRDSDTGLFNDDWLGEDKNDLKWLLTQFAVAEMYAMASEYLNNKKKLTLK